MPPKKKSEETQKENSSTFTVEVEAVVLGQGIDLAATKHTSSSGEDDGLLISGRFKPALNPLKFILEKFGFEDGKSPIELNKFAIDELTAKARKNKFSFSVNDRIFFQTFKQDDPSGPTPLVFAVDFGAQGRLTIPDSIPVIKDALSDPDKFLVELSRIVVATADVANEEEPEKSIKKGLQILGKIKFFSFEQDINLYLFRPGKQSAPKTQLLRTSSQSGGHRSDRVGAATVQSAPKSAGLTKWIDVQKTLGPITIQKIGFQYKDGKIWFMINLDFKLGGFDLSLQGFRLGLPPKFPPPKPSFAVDGVGLSFQKGAVQIAGAFLKAPDIPNYYSGFALIKTAKLTVTAFGGYGELPDNQGRSIFIFASLDMPLGGPPFFFVTGLSLGFGYNMAFKIPTVDQVSSLPLLNTSLFNGVEGNPTEALSLLNEFIYPEPNNLWFAVGIAFTSFKLIDSRALLVVDIQKEQISILGFSMLVLPKSGKAFINIRLSLVVFYKIQEGIFQARAKIADGSYLLDPSCRVFGEFAFFAWFKGTHKGDFVLSVGGYHPRFKKPAHYPDVQRVGFDWKVSKKIEMSGDVYFALTPSAIMAGFRFEATYKSGKLKAWFKALANFLLQWKPFHYDVEVSISLGASYKIFKLEVGADLQVYGPPVGGWVHISWFIISFTIRFGESSNPKPSLLDWNQFKEGFLPADQSDKSAEPQKRKRSKLLAANPSGKSELCRVKVVGGLERTIGEDDSKIWVVRADELVLSTETLIPTKKIIFNGQEVDTSEATPHDPLGIRPMGVQDVFSSVHRIELSAKSDMGQSTNAANWTSTIETGKVASALWATTPVNPNVPDAKMLRAWVGLERLAPKVFVPADIPVTWIRNFDTVNIRKKPLLKKQTDVISFKVSDTQNTIPKIAKVLVNASAKKRRLESIAAINELYGLEGDLQIVDNLARFPTEMEASFQSEPRIGEMERVYKGGKVEAFKQIPIRPDGPQIVSGFALQKAFRQYSLKAISDYTATIQLILKGQLERQEPFGLNAYDGAGYLFALTAPEQLNVQYDYKGKSSNPLNVFTFDAFGQPLAHQLLQKEVSKDSLDPKAHQLFFCGQAPLDPDLEVNGWNVDAKLPLINGLTIASKQLLIKPQAPILKYGKNQLVRMQEALNQNQYLLAGGETFNGWVDCLVFAANVKQVVFLLQKTVKGLGLKNAVAVSIPYVLSEDGSRQYVRLPLETKLASKVVGAEERICYDVPTSKLPSDRQAICIRIKVIESAQKKWQLKGGYVLSAKQTLDENAWLRKDLNRLAAPFSSEAGPNVPKLVIHTKKISPSK
ncbi:MAG: DUF6603 domain-containing protein [Bacteroidota bacterium]